MLYIKSIEKIRKALLFKATFYLFSDFNKCISLITNSGIITLCCIFNLYEKKGQQSSMLTATTELPQ